MDYVDSRIISLPKITDPRGNLSIIEQIKQIPFVIKRVHWVYDVPGEMMVWRKNLSNSIDHTLDYMSLRECGVL